jgi:DNA-binding NarL/FixJ family response regulator
MDNKQLEVFIVDEDRIMTEALQSDLKRKFGSKVNITICNDPLHCVDSVGDNTHMVILAYDFKKKKEPVNGIELIKAIKEKNPTTQVVVHSSNDDIHVVIESLRVGASNFVVKEHNSFDRIRAIIHKRITEPIRRIIREFGVKKFVAIFLLTFTVMGVIVWLYLKNS